jgi:hypothetical protein
LGRFFGNVSLLGASRVVVAVGATLALALGAIGCLSDDTSLSPTPKDASVSDTGLPTFDASGSVGVDGATPTDAGTDAPAVDSSAPVDAGVDAARVVTISQLGLVAGGTLSHSPSYQMTGTTGPATAPVMRSPNYKLVGGMTVTTQKP